MNILENTGNKANQSVNNSDYTDFIPGNSCCRQMSLKRHCKASAA